ncbi:MAG: 4-hydroxybenzoyl-CoA reductase subunit beta [Alphaproteobacteria bacterium]|nr:4-hydroxybenzoyl-CoA reductase subunit beta [Alphaproteobacteria bacterium]
MENLPDFRLIRPGAVDQAIAALDQAPGARLLAGGSDLIPNMRRGLVDTDLVIDLSGIDELHRLEAEDSALFIGAGVTLTEAAEHPVLRRDYPAVAEAADSVAGPTQRAMATVGGNICLDTRCIFFNQSEWWRRSVGYCLKYRGEMCHVVPTAKRCYATYSGDLAAALLIYDAEAEIAGPAGRRRLALGDLFVDDGAAHLALSKNEVLVGVRLPDSGSDLKSGYEKIRIRGSIDFPLAGIAAGLRLTDGLMGTLRIGLTGTNATPIGFDVSDRFAGRPLDDAAGAELRKLIEKTVSPLRTTLIQPQYRRRAIGGVAVRLVERLRADY